MQGVRDVADGFNPHSPLLANELFCAPHSQRLQAVSIHIRHCWRMNLGGHALGGELEFVSIHIRHCWRMNFGVISRQPSTFWSFTPHSPLLANELALQLSRQEGHQVSIHIRHCWRMNCKGGQVPEPDSTCFNPHSPLLANEFIGLKSEMSGEEVSIHIRHCWRMNSSSEGGEEVTEAVSIHIRHCWRMNFRSRPPYLLKKRFQATFAIAGE